MYRQCSVVEEKVRVCEWNCIFSHEILETGWIELVLHMISISSEKTSTISHALVLINLLAYIQYLTQKCIHLQIVTNNCRVWL